MQTISEKIRQLVIEGKAEFIGQRDVENGYKAYYRVEDDGKTYYIFGIVQKNAEVNYQLDLQD
jgi:carotenoid cleavage dioxygenase-like enzyme